MFFLLRMEKVHTKGKSAFVPGFASRLIIPLVCCFLATGCTSEPPPPNLIILFSDDAGYADFGFQGSADYKTPHLDALASSGARFTSGYVTASVCSPSRAGMLTGRYQQRFGHELNLPGVPDPSVPGFSTGASPFRTHYLPICSKTKAMLPDLLENGHLGLEDHFHPTNRGLRRILWNAKRKWTLFLR